MRLSLSLAVLTLVGFTTANEEIAGSYVSEQRGFFRREHSLIRPFQSAGLDVPYFDIIGNTFLTPEHIRLTTNLQGRQGGVWNSVPVHSRDWELQVSFKVHGNSGKLYGDGIAIWYTRDRAQIGSAFGSANPYVGLGVMIDTYANEYKSYAHTFPFINAQLSNGSTSYDGSTDGAATQLGGNDAGCELKLRNKEHETQLMIRYVGNTLAVFEDTENAGTWKPCFNIPGVHLPTGYYLGLTSATGDLSDNHDILSMKFFEIEYARAERENENLDIILPSSDTQTAPRDHVSNPPASKLSTWGKWLLIIIGVFATAGGIGVFGYLYYQDRQSRGRKRFY